MIRTEEIEITFLKRKRLIGYFVYLIKIASISDKEVEYDLGKLYSLNGTNVLQMADSFHVEGEEVLKSGKLSPKEELTGYIAFLKNDFATNEPIFTYEGHETKVLKDI